MKKIKVNPDKIRYLVLEGGGGKGMIYKGMVDALETIKNSKGVPLLPIKFNTSNRQILGIAGASAGAITALSLAIGMSLKDIKEATDGDKLNQFKKSFSTNKYRALGYNNKYYEKEIKSKDISVKDLAKMLFASGGEVPAVIAALILKLSTKEIVTTLDSRGYITGFGARLFLKNMVQKYFIDRFYTKFINENKDFGLPTLNAEQLTFKFFFDSTGVDVRFTGTNVTTGKPEYFSYFHTPDIPIIDAVSISMSIPFYFKPFEIEDNAKVDILKDKNYNKRYHGFWVDGGMLNNYPIHAFDNTSLSPKGFSEKENLDNISDGFKDNVLGFRITDGIDPALGKTEKEKMVKEFEEYNKSGGALSIAKEGLLSILRNYFKPIDPFLSYVIGGKYEEDKKIKNVVGLFNTLMFPSEDGQIRTKKEKQNTIELYSGYVGLFDFTAPKRNGKTGEIDLSKIPIENAKKKVKEYFL